MKLLLSKVNESAQKFVKVLANFKSITEALPVLPYGIDSKSVKKTTAVLSETYNSEDVCIGYIYQSGKTAEGETRLYATDSEGNEVCDIHLTSTGNFVFSSGTDTATKNSALQSELDSLTTAINAELVKIATGISTAGGAYTPADVSVDISPASADNVKI